MITALILSAAMWLILICVGPGYALAAFIISVVVLLGVLGWFVDADHVTVERDE